MESVVFYHTFTSKIQCVGMVYLNFFTLTSEKKIKYGGFHFIIPTYVSSN